MSTSDQSEAERERRDLARLFRRPVIHNTPFKEQLARTREFFETHHYDVEMPELTPEELLEYERRSPAKTSTPASAPSKPRLRPTSSEE